MSVLSDGVVSNLMYPSYFTVRTISIGDFYERFEVLVAVLWYITIFYRLSLFLHVSVHGLAVVLGLQDPRPLLIPLSLIALVMANNIWPNTAGYTAAWPYYSMFFGIVLPILIWMVGIFKRAKNSIRKEN
ncbi:MAG: GerAB/ArcD/ProY family transporter [Bacillota bacterium]